MKKFTLTKIVLTALIMIFVTGCGRNYDKAFYGSFRTVIDVSSYVCESGGTFIDTALLSELIDVDDTINGITLDTVITFNSDGTWVSKIDEKSYDACVETAYEKTEELIRQLLILRLEAAGETGYEGDELDALIEETIGMSLADYTREYVKDILPSLNELRDIYDKSGTYSATEDVLIRDGLQEAYLISGDTIIITMIVDGENDVTGNYPKLLIKEGSETPSPVEVSEEKDSDNEDEVSGEESSNDNSDDDPSDNEKEVIELN